MTTKVKLRMLANIMLLIVIIINCLMLAMRSLALGISGIIFAGIGLTADIVSIVMQDGKGEKHD